jgi:hypothetical protein
MVRTQIQLTEEQAAALKRVAAQENVSVAEIIRRSIDATLRSSPCPSQEERWRRAVSVSGLFHSGHTDIAERHDDYLAEAYEA